MWRHDDSYQAVQIHKQIWIFNGQRTPKIVFLATRLIACRCQIKTNIPVVVYLIWGAVYYKIITLLGNKIVLVISQSQFEILQSRHDVVIYKIDFVVSLKQIVISQIDFEISRISTYFLKSQNKFCYITSSLYHKIAKQCNDFSLVKSATSNPLICQILIP